MTNLFSIFDPSSSSWFSLNWMSIFISTMIIPLCIWSIPSRHNMLYILMIKYINKELENNLTKTGIKSLLVFYSIFTLIIMSNLFGLYPYVFTPTSHLVVTLSFALPMWFSLMIYGWVKTTQHMFTHLVPLGTPMALSVFMVFIETISNIIRPITLSVRLAANMIAGHLLISLLSGISEKSPYIFMPSFLVLAMLMILEYAVAAIQSYVFITLTSLYLTEIN